MSEHACALPQIQQHAHVAHVFALNVVKKLILIKLVKMIQILNYKSISNNTTFSNVLNVAMVPKRSQDVTTYHVLNVDSTGAGSVEPDIDLVTSTLETYLAVLASSTVKSQLVIKLEKSYS